MIFISEWNALSESTDKIKTLLEISLICSIVPEKMQLSIRSSLLHFTSIAFPFNVPFYKGLWNSHRTTKEKKGFQILITYLVIWLLLIDSVETPQILCCTAFRNVPTWSPKGNPLFHRQGADDVAMGVSLPPCPIPSRCLIYYGAQPPLARIEHLEMCSEAIKPWMRGTWLKASNRLHNVPRAVLWICRPISYDIFDIQTF